MSVALLQTKRDAAIAAMEAGSYDDAIKYAMSAKMLLATLPNYSQSDGMGSRSTNWNAQAIDAFISECKQLKTAAAVAANGIRRTKVTYARATD